MENVSEETPYEMPIRFTNLGKNRKNTSEFEEFSKVEQEHLATTDAPVPRQHEESSILGNESEINPSEFPTDFTKLKKKRPSNVGIQEISNTEKEDSTIANAPISKEAEFDFSLLRKKKKKKTVEVEDFLKGKNEDLTTSDESVSRHHEKYSDLENTSEINPYEIPIDFTKLKKKKKKTFEFEEWSKPDERDLNISDSTVSRYPEALLDLQNASGIPIDFTKLKKKKKPSNVRIDEISNRENEDSPTVHASVSKHSEEPSYLEDKIDLSFGKKKRKKKVHFCLEKLSEGMSLNNPSSHKDCTSLVSDLVDYTRLPEKHHLLSDDEEDYTYEYLLSRAFGFMREKNPDIDESPRRKLVMKPPQVIRAGTKRTSLANFWEICKILHRTSQHLQSFLLVELGTTGSVDGNGQLVVRGKFQQKQMENVLRRYIKEYVTCHTCRSPNTSLFKETRLCFMQCHACGSRCSVLIVKSGFQAIINKRAAMRARDTK